MDPEAGTHACQAQENACSIISKQSFAATFAALARVTYIFMVDSGQGTSTAPWDWASPAAPATQTQHAIQGMLCNEKVTHC